MRHSDHLPRLITALREAARLSETEARDAVLSIRFGGDDWGSEAVSRIGGCRAAVRHAFSRRHLRHAAIARKRAFLAS